MEDASHIQVGRPGQRDAKENQPRAPSAGHKASNQQQQQQQQRRPMSAIIPSIMGEQQLGLLAANQRGGATSGGSAGSRQHKLKQRFTVIRKLGKGTYGKVQLAINKETGQEVAIKTIKKTKIENEQDLERVRREIQIMSSIEHPHIIHIYEVFENKDKIVLIMQYASGGELYEYVSQSKVLDEQEARRLFRQIATAIYYCHQNKICHRDLKLENILLDEKNNAKLADFGLSNVFDKSRLLRTFCGSPLYASPEIVQGSPYEGPEVDCWSLGVLLYTLVYGSMPFDGSNFKRLVKQISEASYFEPKQRSQASQLIRRLLCAEPQQRATIRDICLDAWVNGQPSGAVSNPTSPSAGVGARASPTNFQPAAVGGAHPPLLKVAQDMANLTPVRLDILLAITPNPEAGVPPAPPVAAESPVPMAAEPVRGHKTEPETMETTTTSSGNEAGQQAVADQNGQLRDLMSSELMMQPEEGRSTSPVASYIVRDLAANDGAVASDVPMDRNEELLAIDKTESSTAMMHDDEAPTDGAPAAEATPSPKPGMEVQPQGTIAAPMEMEMEEIESIPRQDMAKVSETAEAETIAETSESAVIEVAAHTEEARQVAPIQERETDEKKQQAIETESSSGGGEPVATSEIAHTTAHTELEADTLSGQDQGKSPTMEVAATGADANVESKPKRIKKRIVVVKKKVKKKVSKTKDEEDEEKEQNEEPVADAEPTTAAAAAPAPKSSPAEPRADGNNRASAATPIGAKGGPGKVRIPETFQAGSEAGAAAAAAAEQPEPKQVATRRQSALIADVSQKLLQQQQQDGTGQTSSSAIEMDQHQLASVRVSDTKSEFERRVSLAAAQPLVTPTKQTFDKTSDTSSDQQAAKQHPTSFQPQAPMEQPTQIESRREAVRQVSSTTSVGEPVARLQPSQFQQLSVIQPTSGPSTPTNTTPTHSLALPDGARSEAPRSGPQQVSREGSRSDSVETIKAETIKEIPNGSLPEAPDSLVMPTGGKQQNNDRSSLRINLRGASGSGSSQTTASPVQSAQGPRPAPIARSYKKVTFTKDGTCITETGRIYSTQTGDGTVRHIERKSKVTHYPSESAANSAMPGAAVATPATTTREEIVYGSSQGLDRAYWPRSGRHHHHHQLKRLVMPSDDFDNDDDDDGDDDGDHDDDEFGFRPQSSQHQSIGLSTADSPQHHFYQRDRADSGSSCSSGSTDVFDDIFDTWTGAISMFNQGRRGTLLSRAFATGSPRLRRNSGHSRDGSGSHFRPQSSGGSFFPNEGPELGAPSEAHSRTRRGVSQRCESAGMQQPAFDFGTIRPRRHHTTNRHRHRHSSSRGPPSIGRSSAEPSGYESDAPFERPASATLGSARGRFGSSNLFPRPEESSLAGFGQEDGGLFANDWQQDTIFERMEQEHELLRERFAQQRRQLWKSSTPALHEIPSLRVSTSFVQGPLQMRSDSNSNMASQQQQQQRQVKRSFVVCQTNSGASLKQSSPLDASPLRRNTAALAQQLPPRQANAMGKSSSKSSMITSRLANIQLSQPNDTATSHQQHKSASFIELKRNTSSSSFKQQQQQQHPLAGQQEAQRLSVSSSSHQHWTNEQLTPPTACSNFTGPETATSSNNNMASRLDQVDDQRHQPRADTNSRIQNWLLQSSGNLSVSSGSKSSTSDATLPSSSGRSDITAGPYSSSSAAQLMKHDDDDSLMQRGDAMMTATTTMMMMNSGDRPASGVRHQRRQHTSRTIVDQLPPIAARSTAQSHPADPRQGARSPRAAQPISMIVRSSSRQSMSELEGPGHLERRQVYETMETVVSGDQDHPKQVRRSHQAASSAQISSHKVFAFPSGGGGGAADQQHRSQVVETRSVTTSSKQVFSQRMMSPLTGDGLQDDWPGLQQQTVVPFGAGGQQLQLGSARLQDDFNDLDSLMGSGELDSHSSSSLLEQLRSRGYRSIMNQRMVTPGSQQQQQQQQQQQHLQQSFHSQQMPASAMIDPDVVTSSSNSMMTMSSSGVACGPSAGGGGGGGGGGGSVDEQPRAGSAASPQGPVQSERVAGPTAGVQSDQLTTNTTVVQTREQICTTSESPPSAQNGRVDQLPVGPQQATNNDETTRALNGSAVAEDQRNCGAQSGAPAANGCSPEAQGGSNGRPVPDVTTGEHDDELDEDVREAKANVKGYLERIRETEKFIKSLHEEEERLERQRRESFLFNNMILSTKLNGLKNQEPRLDRGSVRHGRTHTCNGGGGGSYSAPISMFNARLPGAFSGFSSELPPDVIDGGPAQTQHSYAATAAGQFESSPLSCFNSDLFRPTCAMGVATTPTSAASAIYRQDPLEPVKPIGIQAYAPAARSWYRSKSQLGDQYGRPTIEPMMISTPAGTTRRPLSAHLDGGVSSNPYFPSRHRRSVSQVRASPHHHHHHHRQPSASLISTPLDLDLESRQPLMMSEYSSSFGPPNLHQEKHALSARRSHQTTRHHSLAPSSSLGSGAPRATSPAFDAASSLPVKGANDGHIDGGDDEEPDLDELGMGAYRPGSYVPRVAPGAAARQDRARHRMASDLARATSPKSTNHSRSISSCRNGTLLAGNRSPSPSTGSSSTARRRSMQTLSDSSKLIDRDAANCSDDQASSVARRRSWATVDHSERTSSIERASNNSRLSELEQRLQANKRRREELLQGIQSDHSRRRPSPSVGRLNDSVSVANGHPNDDDDDDVDDQLDQSCGFERPSRPVEREPVQKQEASLARRTTVAADELLGDKRAAAGSSLGRLRPSRLESMEARIKRKSYCVKVRSPEGVGRRSEARDKN